MRETLAGLTGVWDRIPDLAFVRTGPSAREVVLVEVGDLEHWKDAKWPEFP